MFKSILSILGNGLKVVGEWMEAKSRSEAEKTGAIKQRLADKEAADEKTRKQLKKSVNHRRHHWRDDADNGSF